MNNIKIDIKLVSNNVKLLPSYQSEGSAGADLRAALESPMTINPGEIKLIPTGIAISIPNNEYSALVYSRSGLAFKHGIALVNGVGVIDSDYRGEISCPLINLSQIPYTIEPLERIAQLVISPVCIADFSVTDTLCQTDRNTGGFGSTGKL